MKRKTMKQCNNLAMKRGIALIWVLLLSSILVIMATTMVSLVIKELRITSNFDESNRAYSAAEAGMEAALYRYMLENDRDPYYCPSSAVLLPPSAHPSRTNPPSNLDNTVDAELGYESEIIGSGCGTPSQTITIKSNGFSRGVTRRVLQSTLNATQLNSTDTFRSDPGIVSDHYNMPNPVVGGKNLNTHPLIIQQFDVENLKGGTIGNGFVVGMRDSSGNTNFGVSFGDDPAGVRVTLSGNNVVSSPAAPGFPPDGRVNSQSINPINSFSLPDPSLGEDYNYRVKLEYSRYGTGITGFTVVRAIILKAEINSLAGGEQSVRYICIGQRVFTVYSNAISAYGQNPTQVKVKNGAYNSSEDHIDINGTGGIYIDNMAFWVRS